MEELAIFCPLHPHDYVQTLPCDLRLGNYLLSINRTEVERIDDYNNDDEVCPSLIIDFPDEDSQMILQCPRSCNTPDPNTYEGDVHQHLTTWISSLGPLPPAIAAGLVEEIKCLVLSHAFKHVCAVDPSKGAAVPYVVVRQDRPPRARRATDEAIQGLETVRYSEMDGDDRRDGSCVICLEDLLGGKEESRVIVRMPCRHVFHKGCIGAWLKNSYMCPLCRFEMPVMEG